jgi:peptidoglycan hydrolase CwlO-like protein
MDVEVIRRLDHLEQIIANLTNTVNFHAQKAREEALERKDAAIEHAEELFKTTKIRLTEMDAGLSRKMGKVNKKVAAIQKTITRWDLESNCVFLSLGTLRLRKNVFSHPRFKQIP